MAHENKRRHERTTLSRPLYFRNMQGHQGFAYSLNISDCGACILTNRAIEEGQSCILYFPNAWEHPAKAHAIWTARASQRLFRVGLSIARTC